MKSELAPGSRGAFVRASRQWPGKLERGSSLSRLPAASLDSRIEINLVIFLFQDALYPPPNKRWIPSGTY